MPKRSSKLPRDPNQLAAHIVALSTGQELPSPRATAPASPAEEKNPAAVALGRLGGMKGGKARAASMSAEQRSKIAKKAASTRWAAKAAGK
jgi:hypothetical protein